MENSSAIIILFIFIVGISVLGAIPGMKHKMNSESWAVGDRNFGRWLNWFIMAGEVYTAFAFLGASGWAYAKGGPSFYILGYGSLAYMVGYYILPKICVYGHSHLLVTQGDLVEYLYSSRPLGILVSCIGVAFLLPYLQLQLTALGLIVEVASLGEISRITAMLIAFVMVAAFVFLSGLRGVASTALIKDIAMMLAMLFFGIYLPFHYFGGVGEMFAKIEAINPTYLIFPGSTKVLDVGWAMSTLCVMAAGFYMWPHFTTNTFSAKDPDVPRHNAVWLPVYHLLLICPMLVGFTALLVYMNNPLPVADMAFLYLVKDSFPVWVLGIVGGAGALACMIPAADLLLSTSLLISRNIYIKGFRGGDENVSPEHMKQAARYFILILTAVALYLSIFHANLLVNLLLTGYSGVTQFFPLIVFGMFWPKSSKLGAICGLLVGEFLVFYLMLNKMDPFPLMGIHFNAGFVALVCNFIVFIVVSLLTKEGKTKLQ
ncbi:sodium:solute symporter family protein [Megasphaera paucivorans]|uniref:Solute:Na+ symporter, SSS family n=1 Tax=Megasphaera paucivorans TaxID=349095 RepID=A0A1G9WEC8_9FIRM|nr:sodium:solute symporter family protein [Megasphaera paucivorans]SDM82591.1 solute:Na+ symporter, SSS family [Megasphaera paucivorans]